MSDWMIFAERLSEQMEKQNLSIRQLAERMNMTPTTIFRYAKGQRVPRASEILKASDALGVTCDYLIGLSDDPKKTSRPSAQPEQRWIPCSERLPEDEGEYLVSFDDGFITTTGYYEGDFELWADAGEPLAWQPLPEAYREEK